MACRRTISSSSSPTTGRRSSPSTAFPAAAHRSSPAYPGAAPHLPQGRRAPDRFHVRGFSEEGTTTTPFDMVVLNRMSRYHLCLDALRRSRRRPAGGGGPEAPPPPPRAPRAPRRERRARVPRQGHAGPPPRVRRPALRGPPRGAGLGV